MNKSRSVTGFARRPGFFFGFILTAAIPPLCVLCSRPAATEVVHADWQRLLPAAVADACIDLYDESSHTFHRYKPELCATGVLPASTFKIFNSLVALDTGVAPDENMLLSWDGRTRSIASWNQDHTLRTAFSNSVVWYYQELARRIGATRMQSYLNRAGYGNGDISAGIDQFWLTGGFRISPDEQIEFLRRLAHNQLPFKERSMNIVRSIMLNAADGDFELRAKTGLLLENESAYGWWVGYLQRGHERLFFATLLFAHEGAEVDQTFIDARKDVTRAAWQSLGWN